MLPDPRRVLAGKVTLRLIFKAKAKIMSFNPNILTWAMGQCNLDKDGIAACERKQEKIDFFFYIFNSSVKIYDENIILVILVLKTVIRVFSKNSLLLTFEKKK